MQVGVLNLTSANFDEQIKGRPGLLVVYAPWCGHCHDFKPEIIHLQKKIIEVNRWSSPKYWIGIMNGDDKQNLTVRNTLEVTGFPSIFLYGKNKQGKFSFSKYEGNRAAQSVFDELINL